MRLWDLIFIIYSNICFFENFPDGRRKGREIKMVNVLEKMLKQQDTVFYSRYFVDEYNILCYHINGLFFMHGLSRSKVFCSGYAVPGATFRRRPFINRKTSKIKRRFLVSFFVVQKRNVKCAKKQEGRKCKIIHKR